MTRSATFAVSLAAAALLSACVFAPPAGVISADSDAIAKMSERAVATCGQGNVREVNAKSFTCK
ncbi:hypothetical protein ACG04Q_18170 [Roseateles sp. DXS20W]|uniref:Lipoprotein n=1 Tax=Pelomonas lactea TaxID=3299030 RepID=A0ABW7GNG7_9BURK